MRTIHQGMYNVAAEDGRREVLAGLQQQQQQNDAVGQMVAGARQEAGQEGFAAGEQSGANKAMDAILANQAGLGNEQTQPTLQEGPNVPPEVMQLAQAIGQGQIDEAQADAAVIEIAKMYQTTPENVIPMVQSLLDGGQTPPPEPAPTGTPQAGLR